MSLSVVILAAGKGTRMRSDQPKVLHQLAQQFMLQYVINVAKNLNPENITIIVGYQAAKVEEVFKHERLNWVIQKEQLGTGDAVKYAMPHLSGKQSIILYGDVPLVQLEDLSQLLKLSVGGLGILTFIKNNPTGYGRINRVDDGIVGIVEEKDCNQVQKEIREINTGIMAVDTKYLVKWLALISNNNSQKEYYLTDIVGLAKKDKVKISSFEAKSEITVSGINSKIELAMMERVVQLKKTDALMEAGVTLMDPARTDVRGELDCGPDVVIDVGCIFEGVVKLGKNVKIGAYVFLKDCAISDNSVIEPYCHIVSSEVGLNNRVGPYARLRPGTTLSGDVHIGNFVEIKNSKVGRGTKINHLSYVGDSLVGNMVNVGAGTVTCNYDGVNKHQTIIEDNVFIGSNAQLIAPVTIRQGATIGAGSTITKDAPADTLSISRAKQTCIPNWEKPTKKK